MKNLLFLFSAILFTLTLSGQSNHRCNHSPSFGKSWISDTLSAVHYTIRLNELNFVTKEIKAQTDILLEAKINNLDQIKLELQSLTVDSVFTDGLKISNFTHSGNILHIPLQSNLNTGETITVTVFYRGQPFHEGWGGFHWSGEYAFNLGVGFESIPHNLGKTWFPCIDDFRDRATYEFFVTVEDGKDAVCGGILEEIIDNGNGTKTYHWKLNQTIPTYLASVAVGDYARWTDVYEGVNENIPVEIWIRPQDSAYVDGSFQNLNAILAIYEDKFGPYRWDRVGYVGTAIGAMEHVTNIAYPHFAVTGGLNYESLLAHELSHMWFGNNVTCASAEDMWLNEGWAVFSDALYQEVLYGKQQYLNFFREMHRKVLQFCHTPGGDGSYFPINQIPQNITYGMSAYDRGATIAHSLRGYLGDSIFFNAMAGYNEFFQYNYASSYDFRDFLTTYTGIDMNGWFDNWVFNSGTPHYSVDSFLVQPTSTGADVTVFLKQKRHGPTFTGNGNKVELTFFNAAWDQHSVEAFFDGETGQNLFQVPFVPEIVVPDFHEKQSDAITDLHMSIKTTGTKIFTNTFFEMDVQSVSDSAFIWAGHQWAPPDPLQTPVQGLTISDYRYWIINGIIPDNFSATGIFWYNRNTYLDDGILTNPSDSIIILYRPSPAYDWQYVDFTKIGLWNIGKFYVPNLQMGEYTVGVCDETFVGMNVIPQKSGLKIYPNPSGSEFNIVTGQAGTLVFSDMLGNQLDSLIVTNYPGVMVWKPDRKMKGTLLVKFYSENNELLVTEKLIISPN
jgi:hypothetical protein